MFVRAFALAFPSGPERAVIVGQALFGEHDFERRVQTLAAALGVADRVDFRGFREDVPGELAAMDVLVHASTVPEPFGQVVVEGMAAGLPVVAARAGGPAEVVRDGVDGLLYPPGDVGGLAGALRRLASDDQLRDRLGAAGRVRSQRFSPEAVAAEVGRVYRQVVRQT